MTAAREVVVIGGGIGGLALARALRALGSPCRVRIFERSDGSQPDRHGITLTPNGLQVLEALGILPEVLGAGARLRSIEVIPSGEEEGARFDFSRLRSKPDYALGILPRALLDIQRRALPEGVELHWGAELVEVIRREGRPHEVVIRTAEGQRRYPADVVVGADGVRSSARRFVTGRRVEHPVDEAYQIMLGARVPGLDSVRQYVARGRLLGVVPQGSDRSFIFWLTGRREAEELRRGSFPEFKSMLTRYAPIVAEPLASIERWEDVVSAAVTMTRCRRWSEQGVVLLGDAAHASTPSLTQGANMALVDAACLAASLAPWSAGDAPLDDLDRRLRAYERARRFQATFQHFFGRAVVFFSRTSAPFLTGARLAGLRFAARAPLLRRVVLETITGLRPRSYLPGEAVPC